MFGMGKKKKDEFETGAPTSEMMQEEPFDELPEIPQGDIPQHQVVQQVQQQTHPINPYDVSHKPILKPRGKFRIIDGTLMENGLIKYVIYSNVSLGNIGEEFDV